jgi:hypothetical protein
MLVFYKDIHQNAQLNHQEVLKLSFYLTENLSGLYCKDLPFKCIRVIIAIYSERSTKHKHKMLAKFGYLNLVFGPNPKYACINLEGVHVEE